MRSNSRPVLVTRRSALRVEALEEREMPATVALVNGSLFIGGVILGAIQVNENTLGTANGSFSVEDAGRNQGTFRVTNSININLNGAVSTKESCTVDVENSTGTGNFVLPGDININCGNRASSITIQGSGNINGSVSVIGGYASTVTINPLRGTAANILGSLTVWGGVGNHTSVGIGPGGQAFFIYGDVNIHAANTLTVNGGLGFLGQFNIDMQQAPNSPALAYSPTNISFANSDQIGSTVNITEPSNASTISFASGDNSSSMTLNLGSDTNNVTLNNIVNGDLTINTTEGGTNTISVSGSTIVYGNMFIN